MAKYKVGDKVRVKTYRVNGEKVWWHDEMDVLFGKNVTIKEVLSDGTYLINETKFAWCDKMFSGLVESTGNEIIDLLMQKLGVGIDEEFEICGGFHNPYYFDESGNIRSIDGDKANSWLSELIHDVVKIKKIPKSKEMTMEELEKALGYSVKIVKGDK